MNLDQELAELLARLGVSLELPEQAESLGATDVRQQDEATCQTEYPTSMAHAADLPTDESQDLDGETELSLFQTSREHYGVFYRLDLVSGQPQLRVFLPDEQSAARMRCYVVRAASGSPVRSWFATTRGHEGSLAYEDARDTTEQHLLFAAGEAMKRLFWAGEPETLRFPAEIAVSRVL